MRIVKSIALLVGIPLLASCGIVGGILGKSAYKENLENIRLDMTTSQIVSIVGHPPTQIYNFPGYTVYEYKTYLNYLDNQKVSEAANLFKSGFDGRKNYRYLVNFFGTTPDNDSSYIVFSNLNNPLGVRARQVHIYDGAKPIYRLFGNESADYQLYVGEMRLHGRPLLMESKIINACMIFEGNRLKGIFAAMAPAQNRTQSCNIPLNLRNEYFNK